MSRLDSDVSLPGRGPDASFAARLIRDHLMPWVSDHLRRGRMLTVSPPGETCGQVADRRCSPGTCLLKSRSGPLRSFSHPFQKDAIKPPPACLRELIMARLSPPGRGTSWLKIQAVAASRVQATPAVRRSWKPKVITPRAEARGLWYKNGCGGESLIRQDFESGCACSRQISARWIAALQGDFGSGSACSRQISAPWIPGLQGDFGSGSACSRQSFRLLRPLQIFEIPGL